LLMLCSRANTQEEITIPELYAHIETLTQDRFQGRAPGGRINKKLIRYLRSDLKKSGVRHFDGGFFQPFTCTMRSPEGEPPGLEVKTWNVVGYIPGNDPEFRKEYIVLGAHYDHLGMGGPSSKAPTQTGL